MTSPLLIPSRSTATEFGSQRRIETHVDVLKNLKIYAGDVVLVRGGDRIIAGCAWPSNEIEKGCITLPRSHCTTLGLDDNPRLHLSLESATSSNSKVSIRDSASLRLREIGSTTSSQQTSSKGKEKVGGKDWLRLLVRENLGKYVVPGQKLEVVYERKNRTFEVVDESKSLEGAMSKLRIKPSSSSTSSTIIWKISWNTSLTILTSSPNSNEAGSVQPSTQIEDPYSLIGGLETEIASIRELLEIPLVRPELYARYNLKPPKGILLHGPPGTGKTHLALTIASSLRSSPHIQPAVSVFHISGPELNSPYHGETEQRLRAVFQNAREKEPSVIILDEVDAICPRREGGEAGLGGGGGGEGGVAERVVATLLGEMDGLASKTDGEGGGREKRVVVVGTTNRPNAIDGALRRPGRFDREIEIGIPSAPSRASILRVLLSCTPNSLTDADLTTLASKTHGYVGADLAALVREAGTRAIKRVISSYTTHHLTGADDPISPITLDDLLASLPLVPPSALRSLTLPVPPTSWSSLGGSSIALIRRKLTECISWPLLHPGSFERLGVSPPRGVLMYGPPGCSKTMVGRALASEGGVNFLGVRGPELLSKYVGESERSVRELFAKARGAKPCIVFFDEIDALAASRSSSSETSHGSHTGILTTLLNEMDGITDSSGVVVVGATNRPWVLDSALMRPGRLDRIIYIPPPSPSDRIEILRIKTTSMAVDPQINIEEIAQMTEGCSGAELSAMCRDAALETMAGNMDAPYVPHQAFIEAAKKVRRQITKGMLEEFEKWREESGVGDA